MFNTVDKAKLAADKARLQELGAVLLDVDALRAAQLDEATWKARAIEYMQLATSVSAAETALTNEQRLSEQLLRPGGRAAAVLFGQAPEGESVESSGLDDAAGGAPARFVYGGSDESTALIRGGRQGQEGGNGSV